MSRLFVPPHALGMTEEEQKIAQARAAQVVGFMLILPGSNEVIQVQLPQAVPIEGVVANVVGCAYKIIEDKKHQAVADKLVPNSHVN